MSAAVVEVKDFETFAFYKAYIKDFQNGKLLVHYEHGWRPDDWVDCGTVRQSVPPHNPQLFDPRVGDSVEALAKSHEQEPFSWWRAKIKTIKGEFYLINYSDWDDTYNEIVEKELLRPPNPNPMLVASELTKKELDIPAELRQTEEERKDVMQQKQKQQQSAEMQQQSGVLTLLEDPVRQKLVILGHHKSVERAVMLANMHFKHQRQLKELQKKKQKSLQTLEESKRRLLNGFVEEFTVDPTLIGFVIGKGGSNIKQAEKAPGVESIRIHSENGQITIVAKDKDSAVNARKMLEFVQEVFPVPKGQIARFVGTKYSNIRQIEKDSGVMRIRVPTDHLPQQNNEDRPAGDSFSGRGRGRGGRGGGGGGRGGGGFRGPRVSHNSYDDEPVGIEVVGTRDSVHNAIMLMQQHLRYMIEAQTLAEEDRQVNDQLYQLSVDYGIKPGGAGGRPPRDDNRAPREETDANGDGNQRRRRNNNNNRKAGGDSAAASDSKEETKSAAVSAEDTAARRKKREDNKARRAANKEKDGTAADSDPTNGNAAATGGDVAPAAPAASEKKPKKPRKPVNRAEEAAVPPADDQQ